MDAKQSSYKEQVGEYYDTFSVGFEAKYQENFILQKIRKSFRAESVGYEGKHILEIGFGPGLDLIYFAGRYPDSEVFGIDVSTGMFEAALKNLKESGLTNVKIAQGDVSDIESCFPGIRYDLIYVYFGALNTVENLDAAAVEIDRLLKSGGSAVLTFVNKWYLKGFLLPLIKGRFSTALARFRKVWGGYSLKAFLPSKCYSLSDVRKAFNKFTLVKYRGYSILYPAWYEGHKFRDNGLLKFLWKSDERIGRSVAAGFGEYSLFVFRKKT